MRRLTFEELRAVFRNNWGHAAKLARELNVSKTTISNCLRGRSCPQWIEAAIRVRANELLAKEDKR